MKLAELDSKILIIIVVIIIAVIIGVFILINVCLFKQSHCPYPFSLLPFWFEKSCPEKICPECPKIEKYENTNTNINTNINTFDSYVLRNKGLRDITFDDVGRISKGKITLDEYSSIDVLPEDIIPANKKSELKSSNYTTIKDIIKWSDSRTSPYIEKTKEYLNPMLPVKPSLLKQKNGTNVTNKMAFKNNDTIKVCKAYIHRFHPLNAQYEHDVTNALIKLDCTDSTIVTDSLNKPENSIYLNSNNELISNENGTYSVDADNYNQCPVGYEPAFIKEFSRSSCELTDSYTTFNCEGGYYTDGGFSKNTKGYLGCVRTYMAPDSECCNMDSAEVFENGKMVKKNRLKNPLPEQCTNFICEIKNNTSRNVTDSECCNMDRVEVLEGNGSIMVKKNRKKNPAPPQCANFTCNTSKDTFRLVTDGDCCNMDSVEVFDNGKMVKKNRKKTECKDFTCNSSNDTSREPTTADCDITYLTKVKKIIPNCPQNPKQKKGGLKLQSSRNVTWTYSNSPLSICPTKDKKISETCWP
jgi:hypothetical protein